MFDFKGLDSEIVFQLIAFAALVVLAVCLIAKGKQKISERMDRRRRRKERRRARVASLVSKHRF